MRNSLAGFRDFLEKTERVAPEKKGDDEPSKPQTPFGGHEEELDIEPAVLRKVLSTEPWIGANADAFGRKWKLMPYMMDVDKAGANVRVLPDIKGARAFKDGRRLRNYGSHRGRVGMDDIGALWTQGWQPALQQAQGAGMPPGGGGLPPL